MKHLIKIDDTGEANGHPVKIGNIIDAFPDLDISGDIAPDGWAWFIRKNKIVETSNLIVGKTQIVERQYINVLNENGTYDIHDDFYVRDMTTEELNKIIDSIKSDPPLLGWTLETDTYFWLPPTPKPDDDTYGWNEIRQDWTPRKVNEPPTPAKIPSPLTPEELVPVFIGPQKIGSNFTRALSSNTSHLLANTITTNT